jgi:hypothetical protein
VLWAAEPPKGFDDVVDAFATLKAAGAPSRTPSWSRILAIGEVTATRSPVGLNQLEHPGAHPHAAAAGYDPPPSPASSCSPGTDSPAN